MRIADGDRAQLAALDSIDGGLVGDRPYNVLYSYSTGAVSGIFVEGYDVTAQHHAEATIAKTASLRGEFT